MVVIAPEGQFWVPAGGHNTPSLPMNVGVSSSLSIRTLPFQEQFLTWFNHSADLSLNILDLNERNRFRRSLLTMLSRILQWNKRL